MSEILYWVIIAAMGALILLLLVKYAKTSPPMFFSKMDWSQVLLKDVKIPGVDITLNGKLVLPKFALDENGKPLKKLPLIFLNHGWHMSMKMTYLMQWALPLALGGPYAVLVYECRGHGKSPGKLRFDEKIVGDLPKIFDFGLTFDEIDPQRVGFIGMSFGGEMALTRAYEDKRIKAIVSIASPHDAKENFSRAPESFSARMTLKMLKVAKVNGKKMTDELNRYISPRYIIDTSNKSLNERVLVIHARHDSLIPLSEFEKNRDMLGLTKDRYVVLEKGGHAPFRQELVIIAAALRFFKDKL